MTAAALAPWAPAADWRDDWARWRPHLEDYFSDGFDTFEDIERRVFAGEMHFWPGEKAAVITDIAVYSSGRTVLQNVACVGDEGGTQEALAIWDRIELWAKAQGCEFAVIDGRRGWAAGLKPRGYVPVSTVFRKAL